MWWVATLKPDRKAPYIERCRDEDDADDRVEAAEREGLSARKYETVTSNIFRAKQRLRGQVTEDFGYMIGNSNFKEEE